jgi:hypothetical protein
MEKICKVTVKENYFTRNNPDNVRIYPACLTSRTFAKIARTATLTPETISLMKELGYKFKEVERII